MSRENFEQNQSPIIDVTDSILIKAKPHQTKLIIIFNWNNVILTAICILIQIDGVCSMMVSADVLLMRVLKVWEDYQLNWNASEYGGIESIRIHPRLIWTPDLLMYNRFPRSNTYLLYRIVIIAVRMKSLTGLTRRTWWWAMKGTVCTFHPGYSRAPVR